MTNSSIKPSSLYPPDRILMILKNLKPHSPSWVQEIYDYIAMLANQNVKLKQMLFSARIVMAENPKNDEAVDAIDTILASMLSK